MITTTTRNHSVFAVAPQAAHDPTMPLMQQQQQSLSETTNIDAIDDRQEKNGESISLRQMQNDPKHIETSTTLETSVCLTEEIDKYDTNEHNNIREHFQLTEESEHSVSSVVSALTPHGAIIRYEREQHQNSITTATSELMEEQDIPSAYLIEEINILAINKDSATTTQLSDGDIEVLQPILQSVLLTIRTNVIPPKHQYQQSQKWTSGDEIVSGIPPLFQSRTDTNKLTSLRPQEGRKTNNFTQQLLLELQCCYNEMLDGKSALNKTPLLEGIISILCKGIMKPEINAFNTNILLSALYKIIEQFATTNNASAIDRFYEQIIDSIVACSFEETRSGNIEGFLSSTIAAPGLGDDTSQKNLENINSIESSSKINVTLQPMTTPSISTRRRSAIIASSSSHDKSTLNSTESRPSIRSGASFGEGKGAAGTVTTEDELTAYKLIQLCLLIIQKIDFKYRQSNYEVIDKKQFNCVFDLCWHVQHKAQAASSLLKQMAADIEIEIIRIFFQHHDTYETVCCYILDKVSSHLLPTHEKPFMSAASNHDGSDLNSTLKHHILSIQCLSGLMEILGLVSSNTLKDKVPDTEDPSSSLANVLQRKVIRNVITLAVQTKHGIVLHKCIQIVNKLLSMYGLNHFKCEFEVFLHSALLRRLTTRSELSVNETDYVTMEEKSVVLEYLQDVCYSAHYGYSPIVSISILDIYLNYDCDCYCTNMFESIAAILSEICRPFNWPIMNTTVGAMQNNEAELSTISSGKIPGNTSLPVVSSKATGDLAHFTYSQTRLALNCLLSVLELTEQLNIKTSYISVSKSLCTAQRYDDSFARAKKTKKRALCKIVNSFNSTNPDKGDWLDDAVTEGFIDSNNDYASAAKLLFMSPLGIDKERVGLYLSRGPTADFPFHALLRSHFVSLYNFENMSFSIALRKFLSKFRLPGEAQCIDRLMETFSKEYFAQQKETTMFRNADAVYVLAFSTIMLNTDLHNRTIKAEQRMTVEQFLRNNRGINAGEDLPDEYLSGLYEQIKERELELIMESDQFLTCADKNRDTNIYWEEICCKKVEMDPPFFLTDASLQNGCRTVSEDLMQASVEFFVPAFVGVFATSEDDPTTFRLLAAVKQLLNLATKYEIYHAVNDVLQVFFTLAQQYISKHMSGDASLPSDFNLNTSNTDAMKPKRRSHSIDTISVTEEILLGVQCNLIPFGLLCSCTEFDDVDNFNGSANNRGLLAMDCGFVYVRDNSTTVNSAWSSLVKCLCMLRDARALPKSLSDLDDFADSSGNVLPLSTFALSSQKRLQYHYRSVIDKDNPKQKGWFRSFFRKNKLDDQVIDAEPNANHEIEPSLYVTAMLGVTESSDIEHIVQMGSSKLPDDTIISLLGVLDNYPFDDDPVGEQHAIFTVELAARALLSNHERAENLFLHFLGKFEQVLCKASNVEGNMPDAPFVIERIVVTILRCCIHLYEYPMLRPHLRASLQLLTMTLPRSFIHVLSDRISCGLAIILRASYPYFEHQQEWSFMNDMLDGLAHYESSRVFVFDGIASTVEYSMPNFNPNTTTPSCCIPTDSFSSHVTETDVSSRPCLSIEACGVLARILTRFVLGYYHGDHSLIVPAMLCLEKVYRRKVEILLLQQHEEHKQEQVSSMEINQNPSSSTTSKIDIISFVPDKELWQNIAVAIYSVCRSSDPDASMMASKCFRRIVIRVNIDEIPLNVWITMLYLMVHKQPTTISVVSRSNTFSLLGQLLLRVIPILSHNIEYREDLEEFILQFAALAEENIQSLLTSSPMQHHHHHRRGGGTTTNVMFDKTLQTLTYICNHILSDEWDGQRDFTLWMNETLLVPIELAGNISDGHGKVVTTFDNSMELDDVSEISDSVAGDEY